MPSTLLKLVTKFCSHIPWVDASKKETNSTTMVEEVMRVYLVYFQDVEAMSSKVILMIPKNQELSKVSSKKSRIKFQVSRFKIQEKSRSRFKNQENTQSR